MALNCFPGTLNPFCRPCICISSCSNQVALATSSSLLYLYSFDDQKLSFTSKFIPHGKSLSCMEFHPSIPGLLVTGGAPNSRIHVWSIEEKVFVKTQKFSIQRRPTAMIWMTDNYLIVGDEHGNLYGWKMTDDKLVKLNSASINDKANDEVQYFAKANKQKFILTIAYKSGLVAVCHLDIEKHVLNLLHKLLPENAGTVCCSIQFSHVDAPLDRSTLFYVSYAHGCIKVCDYISGKVLGQLAITKQAKTNNLNDPRCKTHYPLIWLDVNTLLTGNLDGHLIKIDVSHSTHLEKCQFNVIPSLSSGKPIFSLGVKDTTNLFIYSFSRKLCIYDLTTSNLKYHLVSVPGSINDIQACPLQTSYIALGIDTANVGLMDVSSINPMSISFLWQSIPADVCRIAWHPAREGRVAYSTRLGHVGLYDTLSGRSRVIYDSTYRIPGSPTAVLWGPLIPSDNDDPTLAILYTIGDGKFHRWDSPEKNCVPTDLTMNLQESISSIIYGAFSDDRKYLSVLCLDGSLWLRSCPSAKAIHNFSVGESVRILCYHPRYLLSTIETSQKQYWLAINNRNNIRVIDTLEPSSPVKSQLAGHSGEIECLAWSLTFDFLLASGSKDKTIRLWNVDTGLPLKIYVGHFDAITSILFSSCDPNVILSSSRDQSLHVWHYEEHTQTPDQPIPMLSIDDEDELTTNGSSKTKRSHKPRPNRAERERKRAAKVSTDGDGTNTDDKSVVSTSQTMNEFDSITYQLIWPSENDRTALSNLSLLPSKNTLIERIQHFVVSLSDDDANSKRHFIYHILFWCQAFNELKEKISKHEHLPMHQLFYWMLMLNESPLDITLLEKALDTIKQNQKDYILEYLTMLLKAKRVGDIFDYLLAEEHIESSLFLAILTDSIQEIRERLSQSTGTDE